MLSLKLKDRRFIQSTFCTMYGELKSNHTACKADLARQSMYNPPLELQVACSVYSAAISTLDKIRQRPEARMVSGCKTYKRHLEHMQKRLIRIGQKGGKWEQCAANEYASLIAWLGYFIEGVERNLSSENCTARRKR